MDIPRASNLRNRFIGCHKFFSVGNCFLSFEIKENVKSVTAELIYLRFRQQNNALMPVKSATMTLANLSGNQAFFASNIASLATKF